ncbi:MAG: hypothetical protein A2252_01155 [Elusimicrobia bacterium RIFOXYA2_FULL_39_19]|nr:MAG: hypothetical protein A2252_01155 [Elusimicrobia bacterium RIFOXYA2_FULL_39_19]
MVKGKERVANVSEAIPQQCVISEKTLIGDPVFIFLSFERSREAQFSVVVGSTLESNDKRKIKGCGQHP